MRRGIVLGVLLVVGGLSLALADSRHRPARAAGTEASSKSRRSRTTSAHDHGRRRQHRRVHHRTTASCSSTRSSPGWGQADPRQGQGADDKPITDDHQHAHARRSHVSGNVEFSGASVEVVAQENTKTNMEKMDAFKERQVRVHAEEDLQGQDDHRQGRRPDRPLLLRPAHTNGDAWVVFPRAARRCTRATPSLAKTTPLIDPRTTAAARVHIGKTLGEGRLGIKNVDTIITGHTPADDAGRPEANSPTSTTASSRGFADEIKAGKTVEQPQRCRARFPRKHDGYTVGTFLGGIKNNIQMACNELGQK